MDENLKGPGRPKLNPDVKRGRHVSVRLTEDEYKMAKKMTEFDESLSDLFRKLLKNSDKRRGR